MNNEERKEIENLIQQIFSNAVTSDYARYILEDIDMITGNPMMEDVIQQVINTSVWKEERHYSDDDIRMAIGRELMARLDVQV